MAATVIALVALVMSIVNVALYFLAGNVDRRIQFQELRSDAMLELSTMGITLNENVRVLMMDDSEESSMARGLLVRSLHGLLDLRTELFGMSSPRIGASVRLPRLHQILDRIEPVGGGDAIREHVEQRDLAPRKRGHIGVVWPQQRGRDIEGDVQAPVRVPGQSGRDRHERARGHFLNPADGRRARRRCWRR